MKSSPADGIHLPESTVWDVKVNEYIYRDIRTQYNRQRIKNAIDLR